MTVVRDRFADSVRSLNPAYFAIVMASGIISVGMKLSGFDVLSVLLLIVCGTAYVTLVVLTVWRIVAYRGEVVGDLTDASRGFGFFTFIAGPTCSVCALRWTAITPPPRCCSPSPG